MKSYLPEAPDMDHRGAFHVDTPIDPFVKLEGSLP